jgi:hypothetical protein
MSSKHQPSSRELFIKRVKAADPEYGWLYAWDPYGKDPASKAAFEKLCSDDRMQGVWDLAVKLPDNDHFWSFLYDLQVAWASGDAHLKVIKESEEILRAHADCITALTQLRKSVERMRCSGDNDRPAFRGQFRDLERCIDWTEANLDDVAKTAQANLYDFREGATQKKQDLHHTEFTGLAAEAMKEYFGEHHYELVAAMVAVLFDKETDKEAIRSVVRNFKNRRAAVRSMPSPASTEAEGERAVEAMENYPLSLAQPGGLFEA